MAKGSRCSCRGEVTPEPHALLAWTIMPSLRIHIAPSAPSPPWPVNEGSYHRPSSHGCGLADWPYAADDYQPPFGGVGGPQPHPHPPNPRTSSGIWNLHLGFARRSFGLSSVPHSLDQKTLKCAQLWFIYGLSMVYLWFNYGSTMVRFWGPSSNYGSTMVYLWFIYGSTMVQLWFFFNIYGLTMIASEAPNPTMVYLWFIYGSTMTWVWGP